MQFTQSIAWTRTMPHDWPLETIVTRIRDARERVKKFHGKNKSLINKETVNRNLGDIDDDAEDTQKKQQHVPI